MNLTPDQLLELYSRYYPRSVYQVADYRPHKPVSFIQAWFNGEYASAFRWVPENVRILDIGCGFCESLGYHQVRGCEVYGVEADENVKRIAESRSFNVYCGLFNSRLYEKNFFDVVTMDQVIEHISDPLETVRGIAQVLKPGGLFILSSPNSNGWGAKIFGRYWINWHVPYHLHQFSIKSMKEVASRTGLKVQKVKTITNSEWLCYQWLHLVTYPLREHPSGFWSKKGKLSLLQKIGCKIIMIIHKLKINHLITRLFDLLQMGDNYLFILKKE
ncbi:MAG: class I SAM-dependent methyltransferase [Nitrospinae bacterium]|nr:class I SAM-dependent methyltransferase [Nitrospinota bacterium]